MSLLLYVLQELLRVDDHTLRVAVDLRLGTTIVAPHQCQHCGEEVDCPQLLMV